MASFVGLPLSPKLSAIRRRRCVTCSLDPAKGPNGDDAGSDPSWAVLHRRVAELREKEVSHDRTLAQNWKEGKYEASVVAWASNAYVRKLALHDDFLVFGTSAGGVIFSDLVSGLRLSCANVHTGQVTAIDYSNGYIASAGSVDQAVSVWNCSEFEKRSFWMKRQSSEVPIEGNLPQPNFKCKPHSDIVSSVKVDTETMRLYSASIDGTVRVSDLDNGEMLFEIQVGEPILSMVLTEKRYVLVGCASGRVQAFETESGLYLLSIVCHSANTTAIDFWEESQMLATGDSSGNISLWSFKDSSCLGSLPKHDAAVMSIQLDSAKVVSASRDGSVAVAALESFKRQYTIGGFTKYLACAVFDRARLIADGTNDVIVCHRFDAKGNGQS